MFKFVVDFFAVFENEQQSVLNEINSEYFLIIIVP